MDPYQDSVLLPCLGTKSVAKICFERKQKNEDYKRKKGGAAIFDPKPSMRKLCADAKNYQVRLRLRWHAQASSVSTQTGLRPKTYFKRGTLKN